MNKQLIAEYVKTLSTDELVKFYNEIGFQIELNNMKSADEQKPKKEAPKSTDEECNCILCQLFPTSKNDDQVEKIVKEMLDDSDLDEDEKKRFLKVDALGRDLMKVCSGFSIGVIKESMEAVIEFMEENTNFELKIVG